ncbi:MAG: lytic transglycosylase domain-containing protein [Chloracidobacterium sp.]|nr:lytic transglycosylase domain-containing protein [Chloracidobacterium sp.]MCC6824479.1 lytic transglycosylase domain-containing protein [Acidobacteriota bacterium]MCO5334670.1 lytic transglycosylase domain-containing protein [Pyrinomonadaceae bacterium]
MKATYFTLLTFCLLGSQSYAQNLPRFFDNFDTARGVQVYRPETAAAVTAKQKTVKSKKPLVKRTVQSRPQMAVYEGFAKPHDLIASNRARLTMSASKDMKGFTTGDLTIDSYIVESSRRYGIDPLLIYSQMHQESSFKLKATSYKGASGLMQLMPATARRLGVTNIYDPKQNIEGGVKYMRMLLDMFGQDITLALAGYNAGEGAVMKYGNTIPPYSETREYVRRITSRYASISDGTFARNYRRVNNATAAKLEKKPTLELSFRQDAVAIRLADGRMRLVNQ